DQYGYDASGNVTAILDLLPSNVGSRAMSYDGLDRLETASAPNLWGSAAHGDGGAVRYPTLDQHRHVQA
ncbi:MAG: hypothetical protein ACRYGO_24025, partial [Janthinobacterium lividum]